GATRYRKNLSLTKLEYIDRSCSWLAINYSASPTYFGQLARKRTEVRTTNFTYFGQLAKKRTEVRTTNFTYFGRSTGHDITSKLLGIKVSFPEAPAQKKS
ncbi:MAG: hypothetical protein EAZ28_05035, partial [Oscillatoriales cyanobacterium]